MAVKQRFGGDWTERKLDCLGDYLAAYTKALKKQTFDLVYIDAFAGTGYRELKKGTGSDRGVLLPELADSESARFLDGSVRRSLMVEPCFDWYVFVEKCQTKFQELCKLKTEFPNHIITPVNADANSYLQQRMGDINWRKTRAVLFLDPFGMEVSWDTVKTVASTGAVDLWYLFPLVAVTRMLTKDGDIPQVWRSRLDGVLGTTEWYDAFYTTKRDNTLFGCVEETCKRADVDEIKRFVLDRLQSVFPAVAPEPLVLCNSNGTPLFLFCFAVATHNQKGQDLALRIAGHILGKRRSGGRF